MQRTFSKRPSGPYSPQRDAVVEAFSEIEAGTGRQGLFTTQRPGLKEGAPRKTLTMLSLVLISLILGTCCFLGFESVLILGNKMTAASRWSIEGLVASGLAAARQGGNGAGADPTRQAAGGSRQLKGWGAATCPINGGSFTGPAAECGAGPEEEQLPQDEHHDGQHWEEHHNEQHWEEHHEEQHWEEEQAHEAHHK
jgi:hypothetical protein